MAGAGVTCGNWMNGDAQFGRRVWGAHHAPGTLLVTVFDALPELAHVYFTVFALVRYAVLFSNLPGPGAPLFGAVTPMPRWSLIPCFAE